MAQLQSSPHDFNTSCGVNHTSLNESSFESSFEGLERLRRLTELVSETCPADLGWLLQAPQAVREPRVDIQASGTMPESLDCSQVKRNRVLL